MILRPATQSDTHDLARLGSDSFCAAFAHLYRPDNLQAFLDMVYTEKAVSEEIDDPRIIHFLATDSPGGPLTGFCKMRQPSWYEEYSTASNPIALGQLYTDPSRTGEGIGAALMDWAFDEARTRGCDSIQLSVYSENIRAQKFYQRYGFIKIADIDFWVGDHRDDEFLYEVRIQSTSIG